MVKDARKPYPELGKDVQGTLTVIYPSLLPVLHPSLSHSSAIFLSPLFPWSCIHSIHFELHARCDVEPWEANITNSDSGSSAQLQSGK